MTRPTFWEWLTLPNQELEELGLPKAHIAQLRVRITGHDRPPSERWANSVGSWGRVRTMREIAHLVEMGAVEVKNYSHSRGLLVATRDSRLTQAQLAVALYCDRAREPKESCRHHGVLRAERVLYCTAVEFLLRGRKISIADVLRWHLGRLEEEWEKQEIEIGPELSQWTPDWLNAAMAQGVGIAAEASRR